ncbi:hypothetical protein [Corynebacterium qintianiae]|uniref:hypothetical protein n=1 Tax=Corynebacterium qintianiae TaxID=2709392 RepID=UPI0013EA2F71|nr:hypothetical protein [Corynebacterium qintianiae]
MTSIPPLAPPKPEKPENPGSASHVGPAGGERRPPEALRYLLGCWAVMVFGELVHQLVNAVGLVIEPSALKQAAADAAWERGEDVSDALITVSTYTSIAMMTLFQLAIIALLAFALGAVARRKKWAETAKRLFTVFSVFFVLRTIFVVLAPSAVAGASQLPVAFVAVLGIIQIVVGVAGGCGLIYASRKEVQEALSFESKKDG